MLITIFTDAGFCSNTKASSWAVWAKCDSKTYRYSGIFKEDPINSHMAELQCIVNAVYLVMRDIKPAPRSLLIIQTDSQSAIDLIQKGATPKIKFWEAKNKIRNKFYELFKEKNCTFDLRWVKAHKGTETKRNAVNTFCDKECSRLLNEERKRRRNLTDSFAVENNVVKFKRN